MNKSSQESIENCGACGCPILGERAVFTGKPFHAYEGGCAAALRGALTKAQEHRDIYCRALALALGIETPTVEVVESYIADWQARADEEGSER